MAASSPYSKRVVALVDMDCFYVQVAQRKEPSLRGQPSAVVQYNLWKGGGIIAVSYEARKFGVTRQMRGDEAKRKCPDIKLFQVPESRGKADLTMFRDAGAEVIEVLAQFTDCLERASIDEAYMDLTNAINREIQNYSVEEVALSTFKDTHLVGYDNKNISSELTTDQEITDCDLYKTWLDLLQRDEDSYRMAIGAVIAHRMRKAVQEKTGFSCSAGVGPNKMLAKIVAGFHKPNQQTMVVMDNVPEMFDSTKMRKIRSLGGKLGQLLEDKFKVEFMSQLVPLSLQELQAVVGVKNGTVVHGLCRGIDREPVRPRQLAQSVGCSKNFRGKMTLRTRNDVHKWLTNLCEEVHERLEKERLNNDRIPTLFTVACTSEDNVTQSRRFFVNKIDLENLRDEAFKALCELNASNNPSRQEWTPAIINLHITTGKFIPLSGSGSKAINTFMQNSANAVDKHKSPWDTFQTQQPRQSKPNSSLFSTQKTNNSQISNYFSRGNPTLETSSTLTKPPNTQHSKSPPKPKGLNSYFSRKDTDESKPLTTQLDRSLEEYPIPGPDLHENSNRVSSKTSDKFNMSTSQFHNMTKPSTSKLSTQKDTTSRTDHASTIDKLLGKQQHNLNNNSSNTNATSEDLMICDRCGKRLLAWDLPDHMDFHFAKDLQDSLKENFFSMCGTGSSKDATNKRKQNSSPTKKPSKRLKAGESSNNSSNQLSKYFSPVKKKHNEP
ncbi:DNA polymerase eta-like [Clytia hemisphaerica]|uniref:DNA polymerase eta n=1 Tax=Clytia hemisphaerica TaxID=252671 RepID=A0A7M5WXT0_9CNID